MTRSFGLSALVLLLSSCATMVRAQGPEIAITIDDLPVHAPYPPGVTPLQVNRQMVAALKARHAPVTGFVNAVNVKDAATMDALREWRAAGFVLGNHTWSHPHLSEMTHCAVRGRADERRTGPRKAWRWNGLAVVPLSLSR